MEADVLDQRFLEAIGSFWKARAKNRAEQELRGVIDQGNRAEVTGGTQLGALELLITDLLVDAGLSKLDIRTRTKLGPRRSSAMPSTSGPLTGRIALEPPLHGRSLDSWFLWKTSRRSTGR